LPSKTVGKDKLLNALMRSQDSQVRLRAIEASDKRRERALEREREEAAQRSPDPELILGEIIERFPLVAIGLAIRDKLPLNGKWCKPPDLARALTELEQARELLMSEAEAAATPAE
jgi:hypothetical protein